MAGRPDRAAGAAGHQRAAAAHQRLPAGRPELAAVRSPWAPQPLPDFRTRAAPYRTRLAAHLRGRGARLERGMDAGRAAAYRQRPGRAGGIAPRAGLGRLRHDRPRAVRPSAPRGAGGARHP
ncbi:hypothetical protein G6F22_021130 [Rhizopus arrhizus]|nr:hypothetical protein G6F22_021130 [Rhizopus arrhizus]